MHKKISFILIMFLLITIIPQHTHAQTNPIITLFEQVYLYNQKDGKATQTYLSPQSVQVVKEENGWFLIQTWLGTKWIHPKVYLPYGGILEEKKLNITQNSYIYTKPDATIKPSAQLAPQTVQSLASIGEWYIIQTFIGPQYLNKKHTTEINETEYLLFNQEPLSLYDFPFSLYNTNQKIGSQVVKAKTKYQNWYRIETWLGKKYIEKNTKTEVKTVKTTNQTIQLQERMYLYNEPFAPYKTNESIASQQVQVVAETEGWIKIQTWLGDKWIVNDSIKTPQHFGVDKNKHLFIIQLEAFQNFVINKHVQGMAITPHLNTLIKESVYNPAFYQQIGAGNTSDAEFIINTSIYPLGSKAMSEASIGKSVPSLPRSLNDNAYDTMTFHTNDVTFWNRDKMYTAIGFKEYYDKQYFGTDDIITYGSSDKILYQKTLTKVKEKTSKGKKVYANIIAMSSHHPFKVGKENEELIIPSTITGTLLADYLQSVHYADKQLGMFINGLKDMGIYDQSVIVIFGDHFGLSHTNVTTKEKEFIQSLTGKPYNLTESHNIPFILKSKSVSPQVLKIPGGQVDIYPTVANLFGIPQADSIFGIDLLNSTHNVVGGRYYSPTGYFVNENVVFYPSNGFENGAAYRIDNYNVTDKTNYRNDYELILETFKKSDQFFQQLK